MLHRDQNSSMIQRTGPESLINMGELSGRTNETHDAKNNSLNVRSGLRCHRKEWRNERHPGFVVNHSPAQSANGPGSHKWPQDRAPKREECAVVEMKKGKHYT